MNITHDFDSWTSNNTNQCDRCGRPAQSYILVLGKKICGVCEWEAGNKEY